MSGKKRGWNSGTSMPGRYMKSWLKEEPAKKRKNAKKIKNEDGGRHPFLRKWQEKFPRLITNYHHIIHLAISFDISSQKEYVLK